MRARAGGDETLEREVAALLEHPVSDDEFLEGPAIEAAASLVSASAARTLVGRRLGVYQVQELIGAGGMGEVYRAHDSRLGRDVAIKVLPAEWSADRDRLRRFANEARAAAALNHPHICTIYDVGAGETVAPFIAMELLKGKHCRSGSLVDRWTSGNWSMSPSVSRMLWTWRMPSASSIAISSRQISSSLRTGPRSSISVSRRPRARTLALETPSTELTTSGVMVGTVAYMSPEQLHGETLDGRSDVFSLGLVLYEMATGRPAFTGATASVISAAILHAQPIAPCQLRPDLSRALEKVILKAIEKDRELRYQTAAELRAD